MRLILLALLVLANTRLCEGQAVQSDNNNPVPEFEVASIHPDPSEGFAKTVLMQFTDDGYHATHCTAKMLLAEAFGVEEHEIEGLPSWASSEDFEVEARIDSQLSLLLKKLPENELQEAQSEMLRRLLAERFALTAHWETRQLPIYSLMVDKTGTRLVEAKPAESYANGTRNPGNEAPLGLHTVSYLFYGGSVQLVGQAATIDQLVGRLEMKMRDQFGRTIVNNTGLTGLYDFDLKFQVPWTNSPQANAFANGRNDFESADPGGPSLFTAVRQQLGLKLESTKGPVRKLIVDHIDPPSAN